ncbi:MAG: efflux transporter outer membrane subunit [Alphaproteobacteria bacterium]|nr:efflux transporter outer membrane subunit [Alphaproteobacteria bacterium]
MANRPPVAALGLLAVLSACAAQDQEFRPPQPELPAAYSLSAPEATSLPRPSSEWWMGFRSAELDELVESALRNNHDLKAAVSRIRQAAAASGIPLAGRFPRVDFYASGQVDAPSGGVPRDPGEPFDTRRLYQVGLRASYEIDLWGKNRWAALSADESLRASAFDAETIANTLTADVATAYFEALSARERLTAAQRNVELSRKLLAAVQERFDAGDSTGPELVRQKTSIASFEAEVPIIELIRDRAMNRLAVLVATPPGTLRIKATSLDPLVLPAPPLGLPSDLLGRRPDLRRAEANLAAAHANLNVARARLLPSFNLSASYGLASLYMSALSGPGGLVYGLLGQIAQAVFDGGRGRADVQVNEARREELVEAYYQSVLLALRDVEDSLASLRFYSTQEAAQIRFVTLAQQAHALTVEKYQLGASDYLAVLDTERTRYKSEDDRLVARFRRLVATVDLYKALGGGFTSDQRGDPITMPAIVPAEGTKP